MAFAMESLVSKANLSARSTTSSSEFLFPSDNFVLMLAPLTKARTNPSYCSTVFSSDQSVSFAVPFSGLGRSVETHFKLHRLSVVSFVGYPILMIRIPAKSFHLEEMASGYPEGTKTTRASTESCSRPSKPLHFSQ